MLHFRNSGYKAVTDVTASKAVNFDHHGIDEEGPVPDMQMQMQCNELILDWSAVSWSGRTLLYELR